MSRKRDYPWAILLVLALAVPFLALACSSSPTSDLASVGADDQPNEQIDKGRSVPVALDMAASELMVVVASDGHIEPQEAFNEAVENGNNNVHVVKVVPPGHSDDAQ